MPQLPLTREFVEHETIPRFAWQPPADAAILVCGLFGCPPTIDLIKVANTSAPVQMLSSISNANDCLISSAVYAQPPKIIDVRDVKLHEKDTPATAKNAVLREPVTLRFGCWVYSRVATIGATALERLTADEVPDQHEILSDCAQAADGKSCAIADAPFLGRCLASSCVASCVTEADCTDLEENWIGDAGTEPVAGPDPDGKHCKRAVDAGVPKCSESMEP